MEKMKNLGKYLVYFIAMLGLQALVFVFNLYGLVPAAVLICFYGISKKAYLPDSLLPRCLPFAMPGLVFGGLDTIIGLDAIQVLIDRQPLNHSFFYIGIAALTVTLHLSASVIGKRHLKWGLKWYPWCVLLIMLALQMLSISDRGMAEPARYTAFQAMHRTIATGVNAYARNNDGTLPSSMADLRAYLYEVQTAAIGKEATAYNNKPRGAEYTVGANGVVTSSYVAQDNGKDINNLIEGHTDSQGLYEKGRRITLEFVP